MKDAKCVCIFLFSPRSYVHHDISFTPFVHFVFTGRTAGQEGQALYIQPSRVEQAYLTGQSFFVTCFIGADADHAQVMWRDPEGRPITENEGRIHVYRRRDEPEGIQLVVEEVTSF